MSRGFKALLLCATMTGLFSCGEESPKVATPGEVEIVAEVEISAMGLEETIDWNRELALLSNPALYEQASLDVGTEAAALKEATRLELDPELKVVRVTATHEDGETAERYAGALVASLELLRLRSEMDLVAPGFEDESPLERDRMTYEKAKKALEEEAAGEAGDGVLYRKEG